MSAGAWERTALRMEREAGDGRWLEVEFYDGEGWRWRVGGPDGEVYMVGEGDSLNESMAAADLWASEHGYPTVRVEVDP